LVAMVVEGRTASRSRRNRYRRRTCSYPLLRHHRHSGHWMRYCTSQCRCRWLECQEAVWAVGVLAAADRGREAAASAMEAAVMVGLTVAGWAKRPAPRPDARRCRSNAPIGSSC